MALILWFNIQCKLEVVCFKLQFKSFACLCHLNSPIGQLLDYI